MPWIVRKLIAKHAGQSVDVIWQHGHVTKITSVNAKTSWSRTLHEGRETQIVSPTPMKDAPVVLQILICCKLRQCNHAS